MSIHPKAIHWEPAKPATVGRVTGYESEIGATFRRVDGWHAAGCGESFGPFKTERQARRALTDFVDNGYVNRSQL